MPSSRLLSLSWVALAFVACSSREQPSAPRDDRPMEAEESAPRAPRDEVATSPADQDGGAQTSAAHGAALYARMCAVCHGDRGQGYVADEATALAHPDFLASVSDAYLRFAIRVGRTGTKMSAWHADRGGPLSDADVDALVAHLRSWQTQPALALDESPVRGDPKRGKAHFERSCASCHGREARQVRILNRQLLLHATPGFLRQAILHGRAGTPMPAFEASLGARGVEDVVAYLTSLPAWLAPGEQVATASPPMIPLGPVPLHPKGREPKRFQAFPKMTSVDVVGPALKGGARMAILDARPPPDYVEGHIAGAVSVPFYDPAPYLAQLPKNTWLVCYCGCPHAESGALARKLTEAGFTKVTVLDEGLGVWQQKGHPMRSGLEP